MPQNNVLFIIGVARLGRGALVEIDLTLYKAP